MPIFNTDKSKGGPWLWFALLLVIFVAGDRLGGNVLHRLTAGSQFRYSRLYAGAAPAADILLVGNSRGLAFFQPFIEESTGKTTFNLSYNGMPSALAEVLVKDYLARYPAPKTALIDITLCDRPNKELIGGFSTYLGYSAGLQALIQAQNAEVSRGSKVSALFRYNNEVFQRALFYRNRSDKDWLIDRQITPELAATVPLDTFPISVQPELIQPLAQTVKALQASGTQVYLVIGPYYPGMTRDWSQLKRFKTAVKTATALTVHDYSQALADTRDFGDLMHPNKQGAAHFIEKMRRDGLFTSEPTSGEAPDR